MFPKFIMKSLRLTLNLKSRRKVLKTQFPETDIISSDGVRLCPRMGTRTQKYYIFSHVVIILINVLKHLNF